VGVSSSPPLYSRRPAQRTGGFAFGIQNHVCVGYAVRRGDAGGSANCRCPLRTSPQPLVRLAALGRASAEKEGGSSISAHKDKAPVPTRWYRRFQRSLDTKD
jgi:hypothetical protein